MRVKNLYAWILAAFLCPAMGQPAVLLAEKPEEFRPDRHYFERCTASDTAKVKQGMTRAEARKACKGFEFPAAESIQDGFVFTVDKKRTATARIPGWLPAADQKIDFLCSKEIVVIVYYSKEDVVEYVTRFPMHQASA